jgi:hypothetical protein
VRLIRGLWLTKGRLSNPLEGSKAIYRLRWGIGGIYSGDVKWKMKSLPRLADYYKGGMK